MELPAGNTLAGAVTPPRALVPGTVLWGKWLAPLGTSPGNAAKNSLAKLASVRMSNGLCASLVGVGIVMEFSNFNIF
jgi:hypothetical protein